MGPKRRRSVTQLSVINEDSIFHKITKILETIQHNVLCHEKYLKLLKDIFINCDQNEFLKMFLNCLQVPLQYGEKNDKVERTLDFAAKFCASFSEMEIDNTTEAYEMHPFLLNVFQFALKYHGSNLAGFRYRICQFINKILVFMGEHAELDDKLCDDILHAMLNRLQDQKYKVRTQAIIALHRLQNPVDPRDPVTKAYLFHLESDPNPQVRRAVINNLARSAKAFPAVVTRIQDVDEKVRRDAYNFLSMFSSKAFKIKQRILVLKTGLRDRSPLVRKCVSDVLLPKWFVHFERSYFEFLKGIMLDATLNDLNESIEVSELLLQVFFNQHSVKELIEALNFGTNKLIELENLNHETITYWRLLTKFFFKQGPEGVEYLDEILPELTKFCSFIQSYVYAMREKTRDQWEEIVHQSILRQLFDMIECFDLSEEVGRNNLNQLIMDLLLKEKLFLPVIEIMIEILETLNSNTNLRIQQLVELISDITEPLQVHEVELTEDEKRRKAVKVHELRFKLNCLIDEEEIAVSQKEYEDAARIKKEINDVRKKINDLLAEPAPIEKVREKTKDEENIAKALDIVISMLQSRSVTKFTPELRILQQNLISDNCLQSNTPPYLEAKALRCLAMCAYLDEDLATFVMPKFYYRIMAYKFHVMFHVDVLKVALSAIFDLFLLYGLSKFPEGENTNNTRFNKTKRPLYDNTTHVSDNANDDSTSDVDNEEENGTQETNLPHLPIGASSSEIISCILSFVDEEILEIRTLTADGLCRLLVCEKLKSTEVLTRLIILWFNPATENDIELRQVIGVMLNHYAQHTPGSQEELEKAFFPVLRTIFGAPASSPLSQVDSEAIINFLLTHTQPGFSVVDSVNVHNHLALSICQEIIKSEGSRESIYYIKCLPSLQISEDDTGLRNDLLNLCNQIIAETNYKLYIRYVQKFVSKISNIDREVTKNDSVNDGSREMNNEENTDTFESSINQKQANRIKITNTNAVILDKSLRVTLVRFDDLDVNEENISINDSSSSDREKSQKNDSRAKNIVISTSESENSDLESLDSDELKEPQNPIIRRNFKRKIQ